MFTQCPHCLTLFRITPEQLKAAEGQVRCCQCNKVFNALQRLQESPVPFSNQATTPEEGNSHPSVTPAARLESLQGLDYSIPARDAQDSGLINDSEVEKSLDDLADDSSLIHPFSEDSNLENDAHPLTGDSQSQFLFEQDDGLATEPDYFASGTESQMSELLDRDSASLLLDEEQSQPNLAEIIELDIPEPSASDNEHAESQDSEASEFENTETSAGDDSWTDSILPPSGEDEQPAATVEAEEDLPFTFEALDDDKEPSRSSIYWIIGSLLLLLPLSGQIAWQLRDTLIHHDAGRQLLEVVCSVAGCETPLRKARDKIIITERALTAHPEKQNTLSMQLEMVNTAPFDQPYPKLQLSLYNDMGKLIARRTFDADEYRNTPHTPDELLPKLKPVRIDLELVDPGSEVTGFKFDFL